jgi:hypothetical protein
MVPCDFWLFPQLKTVESEEILKTLTQFQKNATITLHIIPKTLSKKMFPAVSGLLEAVCQLTRRVQGGSSMTGTICV